MRDLFLIDLTSTGLRHFGLKNTDLIDTHLNTYPLTLARAEALYERNPEAQGLFRISRMQNRAQSFILFWPRVGAPHVSGRLETRRASVNRMEQST
jgi:hypothetical protein